MNPNMWVDPPGWLYALSYIIVCVVFGGFLPEREKGLRRIGLQAGFGAALLCFMILSGNIPQVWFLPCMVCSVMLMFGMLYSCCDMSALTAGYYLAQAFIVGEFCASLEWQMFYFTEINLGIPGGAWGKTSFLILTYALIYLVVFLLEKRLHKQNQVWRITWKEFASAAVIAIVIYGLSNLSYVVENTPFSGQLPNEIFNIHTLVDMGGVAILMAYHMMLTELHMRLEMENMQNILNMQYTNYQLSEKSVDMVNRKYHDLKHQIVLLREEFGTQEGLAYLDRMQNEIEIYEAQNKTGNKILDTVLTSKSIYCQGRGIKLTCVADGSALDFMDVMDISALFGNALDNAIESVKKIPDREKRLIHVAVAKQKEFLRIRVENCYEGELVFENGLPKTTKKDKNYHGYGLKSIQSTVKKYNGSVAIEAEDGWFELRILIPVTEK